MTDRNYRRSALVRWRNGRREWLPLTDIDKVNSFYQAMRRGFIIEVETFADEVREGVLPREETA